MSRWFKINDDVLNDVSLQRLPANEFKAQFVDALDGKRNLFSRFIKPTHGRPHASLWAVIRSAIFERDDYTCAYCGQRGGRLNCDHVVPVSKGGPSTPENLVTACEPCNRSKGDKSLDNWKKY